MSLSAVAASDDSQSIAIDENSDIQVPDTLLSSASDDLISADAGENSAGIYGASENSANDISSDEKQNATMDISVEKDVINAGENTTITVQLPENATGIVSIGLHFVNVTEGGVASYNYTSKSVGNHTITVIYYGNEIYKMATSSLNITVLDASPKENVTMDITASPDEIVAGENSTITVQLPDDATGIVSIGLRFINVTEGG
ncbi:Ig-like domain-containing protein, partial [Methanobrevibacter millerae]